MYFQNNAKYNSNGKMRPDLGKRVYVVHASDFAHSKAHKT